MISAYHDGLTHISPPLCYAILHSIWQMPIVYGLVRWLSPVKVQKADQYLLVFGGTIALSILTLVYYIGGFDFLISEQAVDSVVLNDAVTTGASPMINNIMPTADIMSYREVVVICWMIGMIGALSRILVGWAGVRWIKSKVDHNVPTHLKELFQFTVRTLGLKKEVHLAFSKRITVPMTIGYFKPIVLLPVAYINHLSMDEVEAILVHELGHILHSDYLKNIVLMLCEAIYFFHPMTWYLSRSIRESREHHCDDLVVALMPDRLTYAKTLLKLQTLQQQPTPSLSLALFKQKLSLMNRIQRILNQSSDRPSYGATAGLFLLLLASGILLSSAKISETTHALVNVVKERVGLAEVPSEAKVETSAEPVVNKIVGEPFISLTESTTSNINLLPVLPIVAMQDTIDEEALRELERRYEEKQRVIREEQRAHEKRMREMQREMKEEYENKIAADKEELKEMRKTLREEKGSSYRRSDSDEEYFLSGFVERMARLSGDINLEISEELSEEMAQLSEELADMGEELAYELHDGELRSKIRSWQREYGQMMREMAREIASETQEYSKEIQEELLDWQEELQEEMREMQEELREDLNEDGTIILGSKGSMFEWHTDGDDHNARQDQLIEQLNRDGLLKDHRNVVRITHNDMKVNGTKVSNDVHQRYLRTIDNWTENDIEDLRVKLVLKIQGTDAELSDDVSFNLELKY